MSIEVFSIRNKNFFKPERYYIPESLKYSIWESMENYDTEYITKYDSEGFYDNDYNDIEIQGKRLRKIKDEYCDVIMLNHTIKNMIKLKELFIQGSIDVFFDIIELFTNTLDDKQKVWFESNINYQFENYSSYFRLINGRIIKIDDIFEVRETIEKGIDYLSSINMRDVADMVKCAVIAHEKGNYNDCIKYSYKSTDILKDKIIVEYSKKNNLIKSVFDIESFQRDFSYNYIFELLGQFESKRKQNELEYQKTELNRIAFSKQDAEFCLNLSALINQFLFSIFSEDSNKGKIDYKIKPASEFDDSSSIPF